MQSNIIDTPSDSGITVFSLQLYPPFKENNALLERLPRSKSNGGNTALGAWEDVAQGTLRTVGK